MVEYKTLKSVTFSASNFFDPFDVKWVETLAGSLEVEISRPTATKLFNRDIDLKQTEKVSIMSLPKEIQNELMSIYKRIEELL